MKQITVIGPDRPGLMAELTEALAAANINIETISGDSVGTAGVMILTVDRYDEALSVVHGLQGMQAISEDAIVVRLRDEPGALAKVARRFADAGINLRSVRFIQREKDCGLVALSTERTKQALDLAADILVA